MPALSEQLATALQEQVNREFSSGYVYLSMATHCAAVGYKGAAQWLRMQWNEEQSHALKLMDFLDKRGCRPILKAIPEPQTEFGSLLEMFEEVLRHEEAVTASINELYELARKEKDRSAQTFLEWYVAEQLEEESSAQAIIDRLLLAGSNAAAILIVDGELGGRQAESAESGAEGA